MPKLTQTVIKAKADEWASKKADIAKTENAKVRAIQPLIDQHLLEIEPIVAKHDAKISSLQADADSIQAEVIGWLESQPADIMAAGQLAVAERRTETKIGQRIIDVQKFVETAKAKGEAMWDCVSVAIAKAEKLIGKKEVDAISEKKTTVTTTNTLRLK